MALAKRHLSVSTACKMVPKQGSIAVVDATRVMVTSRQTALMANYPATKQKSIAEDRAHLAKEVAAELAMDQATAIRAQCAQSKAHAPMSRIRARPIPIAAILRIVFTLVRISNA